ncbi:hypothetical protein quinque_008807 [Culex quinquefasciatus]
MLSGETHKISWPEESTIHITSSPTIYLQGCHDLSSRIANQYDADPRTLFPQPASIFIRGSFKSAEPEQRESFFF